MQKRKLAACEPCRLLKQACGHERPICERCEKRGRPQDCSYRDRPFKKKKRLSTNIPSQSSPLRDILRTRHDAISYDSPEKRYPNPGHFGSSSHAAIFGHITEGDGHTTSRLPRPSMVAVDPENVQHPDRIARGVQLLEEITTTFPQSAFDVVFFWLARGATLILADPLVSRCVEATRDLLWSDASLSSLVERLGENSSRSLDLSDVQEFSHLCDGICRVENFRWETIGIALVALGRAILDVPFFPSLYTDAEQRRRLYTMVSRFSDQCLEIALSHDAMNDILFVNQYENWILYTMVDGDQSLDSWRRQGDVIGSLMFLGFHELIAETSEVPALIADWRRLMFARTYNDDKAVGVFLGRPPRISSRYCFFQLPHCLANPVEGQHDFLGVGLMLKADALTRYAENPRQVGICWSALCALLKEEALEIRQSRRRSKHNAEQILALKNKARLLWDELPSNLRLEHGLQAHKDRPPVEQDFLLNVRLTYLQILFLLHDVESPLQLDNVQQGGTSELVLIAREMLSLVVEAIVLRDRLVNSGSGLVWKVVHYGLPSAGVVSLSLLRMCNGHGDAGLCQKVTQNLSTLISEIQLQGFIGPENPDYCILQRAAGSIQSLLRKVLGEAVFGKAVNSTGSGVPDVTVETQNDGVDEFLALTAGLQTDFCGYELDFWRMMDEYTLAPITDIALGSLN